MSIEAMRGLKTLASVCPELNMANYGEDDVRHLNDWAIEMSLLAEKVATTEPVMDVRCEGCGYMTHHREHMGCVRAAKQHTHPAPSVPNLIEKAVSSGCFGVLPVKATIPMCKAGWGASGGELTFQQIGHIYEEMYKARPLPDDAIYAAPSVPDGLQWFTVAEHGLPEVGEVVVGGLWYTDPWLKPEHATYFMWGQCRVVDTKHRDFKDGKQWRTFGPSHNQITNWARLNPPAIDAAKDAM